MVKIAKQPTITNTKTQKVDPKDTEYSIRNNSDLNISVSVGKKEEPRKVETKIARDRENINNQQRLDTERANRTNINVKNQETQNQQKSITVDAASNSVSKNENIEASNSVSKNETIKASNSLEGEVNFKIEVDDSLTVSVDPKKLQRNDVVIEGKVYKLKDFTLPKTDPDAITISVDMIRGLAKKFLNISIGGGDSYVAQAKLKGSVSSLYGSEMHKSNKKEPDLVIMAS